jgi:RNA binding exosome subunit
LDRIEAADATRVLFNRPVDFDLHEHLAKSFGVYQGDDDVHVKVRFSPTVPARPEKKDCQQRHARRKE